MSANHEDWIERELNPRPPRLWADRVSTYASPLAIGIRFLSATHVARSRIDPDRRDLLELTNVAEIVLSPPVAVRCVYDLERAIDQYRERMGNVPTLEDLGDMWARQSAALAEKDRLDRELREGAGKPDAFTRCAGGFHYFADRATLCQCGDAKHVG